jgi:hypothetical protein
VMQPQRLIVNVQNNFHNAQQAETILISFCLEGRRRNFCSMTLHSVTNMACRWQGKFLLLNYATTPSTLCKGNCAFTGLY